jgi:lipopolysaccharide/colanic/teichoic acid biosynthesis glycosyltransferase
MYKILKPSIDWSLALLFSIVLFPLFMIIALLIKIESPGPVFFLQKRLGRKGKVFTLFKFRSMFIDSLPAAGSKILFENDPRITRVGRIIRKTSIDEIPQLINILKGEMSFIGPRPPTTYYPKKYSEYNSFELERFSVKPGISGLAQIRCREIHDWNINIPIDVEYVRTFSFINDLKLFLLSFVAFFRTDNIYTRDQTA